MTLLSYQSCALDIAAWAMPPLTSVFDHLEKGIDMNTIAFIKINKKYFLILLIIVVLNSIAVLAFVSGSPKSDTYKIDRPSGHNISGGTYYVSKTGLPFLLVSNAVFLVASLSLTVKLILYGIKKPDPMV